MVWSTNRDDGGVWAGVWWCDDVSPRPDVDSPPYNALKSSGVLLHFRWWWWPPEPTRPFLLLSIPETPTLPMPPLPPPPLPTPDPPPPPLPPPPTTDRTSCEDNPSSRLSCAEIPINRLSCIDINFDSWPQCWWWLLCDSACSSSKPCCSPNRPPTRLGRRSSISFDWLHADDELPLKPLPAPLPTCPPDDPPDGLPVKFNCLLNIAGNILNCWPSGLGEFRQRFDPLDPLPLWETLPCCPIPRFVLPVVVAKAPPRPPPLPPPPAPPPPPPPPPAAPPPKQLLLKSNLFPKSCCFWASVRLFSSCDVRSGDRYSLKLVSAVAFLG